MKNQDVSIEVVASEYSLLVFFVENIKFFIWFLGIIAIGLTIQRYFAFKSTALILHKDDYIELEAIVERFRISDKTFCSKCDDYFNHIEENYARGLFFTTKTDTFCANCHPSLWENWCLYEQNQKERWKLRNRRDEMFVMCIFFGMILLFNYEDSVVLAIFFK